MTYDRYVNLLIVVIREEIGDRDLRAVTAHEAGLFWSQFAMRCPTSFLVQYYPEHGVSIAAHFDAFWEYVQRRYV